MLIKEIHEKNKELKLYKSWSMFTSNNITYRRLVLQKDGTPHIISKDCEALINGKWIPYPSP